MKKILVSILTVILCTTAVSVNAEEEETSLEDKINQVTNDYLSKLDVKSTHDLSYEETLVLLKEVDKLKNQDSNIIEQRRIDEANRFKQSRATWEHRGAIFVTGDSKFSGWAHGHAGIGTATVGSVIEAANAATGIVTFPNRVATYWSKKNSSILGVTGATSTNYSNAFIYANSKLGPNNYGFDPLNPNDFYCSELVYYAWKNQGYQLGPAVGLVAPSDLYRTSKTYVKVKYNAGF